MKLLTILLLCTLAVGCGYGSNYNNNNNNGGGSAPTVSSLSPNSATHGGAGFTLTVGGTNFTSGSVVYWGTTALAAGGTGYVSTTQVTAQISSAMIANAGTVNVYVHTSSGNSNTMQFTIN